MKVGRLGLFASAALALTLGTVSTFSQGKNLEERVATLEKKVAKLESRYKHSTQMAHISGLPTPKKMGSTVPVRILNKKYRPADPIGRGTYMDIVSFDAIYDFTKLGKSARAIKGTLLFQDLFREEQIRISVTINSRVMAQEKHAVTGTAIDYNQFLNSHNWLRGTKESDMVVVFRIDEIIYEDGTRETF